MRLRILSGRQAGEVFPLPAGEHLIGTGKASQIQLREKQVGFKHARLTVADEELWVEDLKSRYGTFVNGERVEDRAPLHRGDQLRLGTAELVLEEAEEAASAPDPGAASPEAGAPPEPTVEEALSDDPAVLQGLVRQLRRRLAEKSQEAEALSQALDSLSAGGGDDAAPDPLAYTPGAATELEARLLELSHIADERTAEALEKDEELRRLEAEVERVRALAVDSQAHMGRKEDALAAELLRSHEQVAEWRELVGTAQAEVSRFEQVNAELLLENEELKERLEALSYRLEQEAAQRGTLIRERVAQLQAESARSDQAAVELRTRVAAYEEKIDELDERVEELEGENEALEQLVTDLRRQLAQAGHERGLAVSTLRQRLQRTEQRLAEATGRYGRPEGGAAQEQAEAGYEQQQS